MEEATLVLTRLSSSFAELKANPLASLDLLGAYREADPLFAILLLVLWIGVACFLSGSITQEFSWVDRIWSIVPFFYSWMFALHPVFVLDKVSAPGVPRLFIQAGLATAWGLRLTYNFARKGGYTHMEDYRWAEVRTWFNWWGLQAFNLTFISFYQNLLLLLIVAPSYICWQHLDVPLGLGDVAVASVFISLFAVETMADQQQWVFQNEKYRQMAAKESLAGEYADGFLQSGLFRYSRHPNFFAEISMWWTYYAFSVVVSGKPLNWTIIGAVLLNLLFLGSTSLTEDLSCRKYAAYKEYQKRTSRLIPWLPSRTKKAGTKQQ